jgi:SAM-dependent methyltransferase
MGAKRLRVSAATPSVQPMPTELSVPATNPWDRAAAGWNAQAPLIRAWLGPATVMMLDAAHVEPGARVLDVAAGAGDQTLDAAQRVGTTGEVLATDASAAILEFALANARIAGHPQVRVQQADAQALGLAGRGFDAAISRLGLMFCTAPGDALRCIHDALRPGAWFSALVFAAPEYNPCLTLQLAVARQHAGLPPACPAELCAPGLLMSLGHEAGLRFFLHEAGFVNIAVYRLAAPFRTHSVDRYVEFIQSAASPVIALLAGLSEPQRQAAWADMRQQLAVFATATAWEGPKSLLLLSAQRPI